MNLVFAPKTKAGKLSAGLGSLFFLLYACSAILAGLSQRQNGEEITMNPVAQPYLIVGAIVAIACGLAAFVAGLISVIKYKERSVLTNIAVILGLFVVLFLLGEFLLPH